MNISDFVERSNPEDREWEKGEIPAGQGMPEAENKTVHTGPNKQLTQAQSSTYVIIAVVVLAAAGSLGLGLLAGRGSAGSSGLIVSSIPMTHPSTATLSASALDASTINAASSSLSSIPSGGEVIGSKSTHMYYLPWCAQVAQISKADEVIFATEQDANTAGFTPGAGCKGI
jgi:hypothetical protein